MILFVENTDKERQYWVVNDINDLAPVFATYPSTHEIAMNSETLREACESIAEYLSGHAMSSWVEDTGLSKSLRAKAAGLAIGLGAMAGSGAINQAPHPISPSKHITQVAKPEAPAYDFGKNPHDRFLWNIKQIESSGGKNVNHQPIASGKFKGHRAIGKWGLLKPTVNEVLNRMKLAGKDLPPGYEKISSMSRDQLEDHFKQNPQIELDIARALASHVMKRQAGNKARAAYSWLHGHNLHPENIPHEKLTGSQYVEKYRAVDTVNPFAPKPAAVPMKKVAQEIGDVDFKERVKSWFKRREDELTEEPMRSSNFQPDPGRIRDPELDQIKPDSMRTPLERLTQRTKEVNKDTK